MSPLIEGRLPGRVRPELYHLRLTVVPEERRFEGEVTIEIQVAEPTDAVTLHALELEVSQATGGKTVRLFRPASPPILLPKRSPSISQRRSRPDRPRCSFGFRAN
ncbi:MAG: hypothetical protein MPW16_10380 [Candidatus Manganitrophus sp.]|nr:MAG: hypothetical protein MPW16_10380 [Candidatus Manganitrophus sp.]